MENSEEDQFGLISVFVLIKNHIKWVLAGSIIGGVLAFLLINFMPINYSATAVIRYDPVFANVNSYFLITDDFIHQQLMQTYPQLDPDDISTIVSGTKVVMDSAASTISVTVQTKDFEKSKEMSDAVAEIIYDYFLQNLNTNWAESQTNFDIAVNNLSAFLQENQLYDLSWIDLATLTGEGLNEIGVIIYQNDAIPSINLEQRTTLTHLMNQVILHRKISDSRAYHYEFFRINSNLVVIDNSPIQAEQGKAELNLAPLSIPVGILFGFFCSTFVIIVLDWWKKQKSLKKQSSQTNA